MTAKAPANLTANARRLWTDTTKKYELETHELLVLEQACRELALVERLQRDIDALETLMDTGSMGQKVVSGLVSEIRQHRSEFTRLLKALALPVDDDTSGSGARSASARSAALVRWRGTA